MGSLAVLVVSVLVLLLVLEVLDAIHNSVFDGVFGKGGNKITSLRQLVAAVIMVPGHSVGLFVHELAHAGAQLLFGGRPAIVLLKNGGFARSSPWLGVPPFPQIHSIGYGLGGGIMALAPILVVGAGLSLIVVAATPITVDGFGQLGNALATSSTPWDVVRDSVHVFDGAKWWLWPAVLTLMILVAPSMTPSTTDYGVGIPFLVSYSIACLAISAVGAWGALGAAGAGLALLVMTGRSETASSSRPARPRAVSFAWSLLLSPLALYAIAWIAKRKTEIAPAESIGTALGVTAFTLGFAAVVLAAFTLVAIVIGTLARPTMIFGALAALPRHLLDLFRPFATCETCKVHFREQCDGCGRLPDGTVPPKSPEPTGIARFLVRGK